MSNEEQTVWRKLATFMVDVVTRRKGSPNVILQLPEPVQPPENQFRLYERRAGFKRFVDKAGIPYDEGHLYIGFAAHACAMMATYGKEVMTAYREWEDDVVARNCEARMDDWFDWDGTMRPDAEERAGMTFEKWVTENGGSVDRHGLTLLLMIVYANAHEAYPMEILFEYDGDQKQMVMWLRFDGEKAYTGYFC
jgi:hypothetical protein